MTCLLVALMMEYYLRNGELSPYSQEGGSKGNMKNSRILITMLTKQSFWNEEKVSYTIVG